MDESLRHLVIPFIPFGDSASNEARETRSTGGRAVVRCRYASVSRPALLPKLQQGMNRMAGCHEVPLGEPVARATSQKGRERPSRTLASRAVLRATLVGLTTFHFIPLSND